MNNLKASLTFNSDNVLRGHVAFKGERGFSAYEIAVKHGFEGTEEAWLASLGDDTLYNLIPTNVINFGATGDGVTDDTKAIQDTFETDDNVFVFPKGIYLCGIINIPDNSIVYFENVTFKRNDATTGAFVNIGNDCVVYGNVEIDGNKSESKLNQSGISFGENNRVYANVVSHNNSKHGIIIQSNSYINFAKSYDNGFNPSSSGTGDGIYLVNVNNTIIEHCETCNNARNGISVTTYNYDTNTIDKILSKNVNIKSANSYDNGYIDIDYEGIQDATLSNVRGNGKVSGSDSANCRYQNMEIKSFYADGSNYYTVKDVGISPKGNVSQVFFVNGYEINVDNVTIHDTADSYTSNTFQVTDTKERGIIKNIHIKNGNNGCVLTGCYEAKNIFVDACNNRKYTIDGRFPSDNNFEIERGLLKALFPYKPNTGYGYQNGTYKKCDVVYNSTLKELGQTGSMYVIDKWVCKETGNNSADNWIEYRSLTGN